MRLDGYKVCMWYGMVWYGTVSYAMLSYAMDGYAMLCYGRVYMVCNDHAMAGRATVDKVG